MLEGVISLETFPFVHFNYISNATGLEDTLHDAQICNWLRRLRPRLTDLTDLTYSEDRSFRSWIELIFIDLVHARNITTNRFIMGFVIASAKS
jgi:hypothetical protein